MFKKLMLLVAVLFFLALAQKSQAVSYHASNNVPVCPGPGQNGFMNCHAKVVVDGSGKPAAGTLPSGYGPVQFLTGYNLGNGQALGNQTIGIVDAYDQPNIKSDLDTYNRTFKLPNFPTCGGSITTSCFQKVDQRGGTTYPRADAGWGLEISLDVEVAHAVCQNCKILLVEADSNGYDDLMAAVDMARQMGANVISNSYGSVEFSSEATLDSHFNYPGVVFTFSAGDSGYGPSYPAASGYVTSVGGTSLYLDSNSKYVSEAAWNGTGSGCSAYEPKPVWQKDTGCSNRTIADISAVADPNTGAAVYDSTRYQGKKGWFKVGGTSLSAPLIAGVYALSGNYNSANPYTLGSNSNLHDVVTGSNGSCNGSYLCTSLFGYDGPTGLGTPNGYTAF